MEHSPMDWLIVALFALLIVLHWWEARRARRKLDTQAQLLQAVLALREVEQATQDLEYGSADSEHGTRVALPPLWDLARAWEDRLAADLRSQKPRSTNLDTALERRGIDTALSVVRAILSGQMPAQEVEDHEE